MSCGSNNANVFGPISKQTAANISCGGGCGSGDGIIPCPPGIGPRKNRGKAREQIKDEVLLMLGAPVIKIELDEQQLDLAVDSALRIIEDYCPREYFSYYTFYTTPGKSVYKMPPDVGHIRNVFYKQMPRSSSFSTDLDGALPVEYLYGTYGAGGGNSGFSSYLGSNTPMWGSLGDWQLFKGYENMYSKMSSQIGGWEWIDDLSHIKLYPSVNCSSMVIVHYLQTCKDWKIVRQEMVSGSLAIAKCILGRIRSRYTGSFGPSNSAMQNDGIALLQEGNEELKTFKDEMLTKFGDILPITMA